MFSIIPSCQAVLVYKGVYKQVDCYSYNGGLYAKALGGFIRLKNGKTTSHYNWRLEEVQYPDGLKPTVGDHNNLCWPHENAGE